MKIFSYTVTYNFYMSDFRCLKDCISIQKISSFNHYIQFG